MYSCDCDDCKTTLLDAKSNNSTDFKDVLKAGEKAFKHLLKNGGYKAEDIKQKPYQNLISETNKVFQKAVQDNVISTVLRSALESDAFLFGSLKTHAQLFEANTLLINKDGLIKSQAQLEHELNKLNVTYNNNYLEAERQFAVSSAISTDNWSKVSDRYNLQYRTANDNKVRDEHRVLHDITLSVQDAFWRKYYPPNGWRCRCVAIQVRKSKYPESDPIKAMELGDKATMQIGKDGKNRLEIFRFNPGASLKLMPPEHPYNKVAGADKVKQLIKIKPEGLDALEKKFGIEIPTEQLNMLKHTEFKFTNSDKMETAYIDAWKQLNVNDKNMVNATEFRRKQILVHELGHAIDRQHDFANSKHIKDIMEKYREKYSQNRNSIYKKFNATVKHYKNAPGDDGYQIRAAADILKTLNNKFGYGHSTAYFDAPLKQEREFIAHCFENKFVGNDILKKIDPDLYEDMVNVLTKIN